MFIYGIMNNPFLIQEIKVQSVEEKMIIVRASLEDKDSLKTPNLSQVFERQQRIYYSMLLNRSHVLEFE